MNTLKRPVADRLPRGLSQPQVLAWILGLSLVIVLFATQWYAYDISREMASPYLYYLGWSCWIWALAPVIFALGNLYPIRFQNWQATSARHVVLSIAVSSVQTLAEATFGWLRHGDAYQQALTHYFVQHSQLYLLTYWALILAAQLYRLHVESHERDLKTSRLESQLSEARLDLLRGQLQPHFLFNTLNAAIELVQGDPRGAEDVLLSLSRLLRASLAEQGSSECSLRKELEFIDCYLSIQEHRFGTRLKVQKGIDPDALEIAVPSLILQPLVENAISHGIGKYNGDDQVSIFAHIAGNRLLLEVRNELSYLPGPFESLLSRGVGLSNTRSRLRELYAQRHEFGLENLHPKGVSVKIAVPVRVMTDRQSASAG